MKNNSPKSSGRRGSKSRKGRKSSASGRLADVTVDTAKCLSMLRRVVRKSALPEVPDIPCGPFLN